MQREGKEVSLETVREGLSCNKEFMRRLRELSIRGLKFLVFYISVNMMRIGSRNGWGGRE